MPQSWKARLKENCQLLIRQMLKTVKWHAKCQMVNKHENNMKIPCQGAERICYGSRADKCMRKPTLQNGTQRGSFKLEELRIYNALKIIRCGYSGNGITPYIKSHRLSSQDMIKHGVVQEPVWLLFLYSVLMEKKAVSPDSSTQLVEKSKSPKKRKHKHR